MADNATDVLAVAQGEVGYSRWDDPQPGTKYGRWYAAFGGSYYGTSGVPYCAMFVSWVFDQAGASCPGLPGAYCPTMLQQARKAGSVLSNKRDARAGDVVYFDWDGDGVVDHVGLVVGNGGGSLATIEGNTSSGVSGSQSNGGLVARRTRSWGTVYAVVRPPYATAAASTGGLDVDGWVGGKTVAEWQSQCSTYADGKVTGQDGADAGWFPALVAVEFDGGGSQLVGAVQRKVGMPASQQDGYLGAHTVGQLQGWLCLRGYPVDVDGYLGQETAKALQRSLNDGLWKR